METRMNMTMERIETISEIHARTDLGQLLIAPTAAMIGMTSRYHDMTHLLKNTTSARKMTHMTATMASEIIAALRADFLAVVARSSVASALTGA